MWCGCITKQWIYINTERCSCESNACEERIGDVSTRIIDGCILAQECHMIMCDVANMIMDTKIVTKVQSIRQGTHLADSPMFFARFSRSSIYSWSYRASNKYLAGLIRLDNDLLLLLAQ